MDGEAPTRADGAGPSWLPRSVERTLARLVSAAEAASRGRIRQAIGVVMGPLVAAAAWIGAWELLFAFEGYGPLPFVIAVATWLVFFPAIAWAFLMLAFLLAGRRWASVVAAPLLYLGVGIAYAAGGPMIEGPSFGSQGLLLNSLMWPVLFMWAEIGCGLDLGLCPN